MPQRQEFERNGLDPWTTIYQRWRDGLSNGGQFAVFAPKTRRDEILATDNWDVHWGFGTPEFFVYSDRGIPIYHRYGDDKGFEPLVIIQDHSSIRQSMMPQLSEEFRLYHNLWMNQNGTELYKIEYDGTEELVARVSQEIVQVRTRLLRQFQAGRQLDLVLYVDSVVIVEDNGESAKTIPIQTDLSGDSQRLTLSRSIDCETSSGSFLLGKKILSAPEIAKAGIPPWSDKPEENLEFIIDEDVNGDPIEFTCDPSKLGNFFGANPESPDYTTPVYFGRQVLQKYYNNPNKYSVGDGSVFCGNLWGLRLDNNHPQYVIAMLGDLGTYIPQAERRHWRQYNVVSSGGLSDTTLRRWFLSLPANPEAPDLRFKLAYSQFRRYWREKSDWDLYRDLIEEDLHIIQRLRIPLDDNEAEFEEQIICLSKLLIDSLNEKEIQQRLAERVPGEKGIGKLERWFRSESYPHGDRDIAFLKRLQALRSRLVAHRKGSDYASTVQSLGLESSRSLEIAGICSNATEMLRELAQHFGIDSSRI